MINIICEKCKQEFTQKNLYIKHINKKNKCILKNNIHIPKPILKWIGGKTQILEKLIVDFPNKINNYHEIFLGGGSVLLTLLSYIKNGIIKVNTIVL